MKKLFAKLFKKHTAKKEMSLFDREYKKAQKEIEKCVNTLDTLNTKLTNEVTKWVY